MPLLQVRERVPEADGWGWAEEGRLPQVVGCESAKDRPASYTHIVVYHLPACSLVELLKLPGLTDVDLPSGY